MKAIIRASLTCILLIIVVSSSSNLSATHPFTGQYLLPGQSCTVFYGSDGESVLGGNNEDFVNPLTYTWFVPAEKGSFGQVYFGYDDGIPQGAVNDQGLFYDGLALPFKAVKSSNKPVPLEGFASLIEEIFATASSVQQVQEIFSRYNMSGLETAQLLFGDRTGNSIIIDGDTIVPKQGKFQVATNFRLADYASSPPSVDRFDTATRMLSEAGSYSVDLFREILDATHLEAPAPTQYSQVYDLVNKRIYLYHFHDFTNTVVLDIAKELAKGPHGMAIKDLFAKNQEREDFAQQPLSEYQAKAQAMVEPVGNLDEYQALTGAYHDPANPKGPDIQVYIESGKLYYAKTGRPASQLYPLGKDLFSHLYFYGGEELRIQFLRDGTGKVSGAEASLLAEAFGMEVNYHLDRIPEKNTSFPWIPVASVGVLVIALGIFFGIRKIH